MVKNEIEKCRRRLNKMLIKYDCGSKEVLKISRELDMLIVRYIEETSSQQSTSS